MKTKERFFFDHTENKIVHHRQFDLTSTLKEAKQLREMGLDSGDVPGMSDSRLVARFPMSEITKVLKEAGVRWDDPAADQVLHRALMSRDYSQFRVWGGNLGRESESKIVVGPTMKAKVEQHWEGKH